jgi:hypothetical protein
MMPSFSSASLSDIFGSSPAFEEAPDTAAFGTVEAAPAQSQASPERTKSWYNPF